MLLVWWDYTFGSYQSNDWNFHFSGTQSSTRLLQSSDPSFEIRQQCEAFLQFLRNSEHLALVQKYTSTQGSSPYRNTIFNPGTTLRNLLSSPIGLRIAFPARRRQLIARLGALLSINVALWDYRNSTEHCERYLKSLAVKIVETELDIYPSAEAFCQILIDVVPLAEEGTALRRKEMDRPWFVGRMLKVAKRLGRASWRRLNDMLLGFLTLDETGGFDPGAFGWEEELRREILDAPLTALVLPAFSGP
jgi:hypothetical protein